MLTILALDEHASVHFSLGTGKWYVSSRLEITDGSILRGVTMHRETPDEAVRDFLLELQEIKYGSKERIVANAMTGERREYQWNGAAFTAISR
jgi:hypothetical protein